MFKILCLETPVVIFTIAGLGAIGYMVYLVKQEKINWSPCGQINLTTNSSSPHGDKMFRYFDDGTRVWRINGIKPPVSDKGSPVVEMVLEFERSSENCAIWKMEH